MTARPETLLKLRHRSVGIVFLVVLATLAWVSVAAYNKQFTPTAMVTLYTDSAGNEMQLHAEVKARGIQVGEVRAISANGRGATLRLAIQPAMLRELPANVSAQMLPTTLFGERYVDLIIPPNPSPQTLTAGGTITQDRSRDAIELEKVLNDLLPALSAVQPEKLAVTLTAITQALHGRGGELGQTLDSVDSYLTRLNPQLPTLDSDVAELADVTRTYSQAAPDILQALDDFTVTNQTIVDERSNLRTLYAMVRGTSGSLTTFLDRNSGNLIRLSADSVKTLRILGRYSPEFPCVLQDLVNFEPSVDKLLGAGTSKPGLHVTAVVVPSRGKYVPGRDTPVYNLNTGPRCYPIPFSGLTAGTGSGGAGQRAGTPSGSTGNAASADAASAASALPGLGLANSPQENELINELLAPRLNAPPAALPDWSSVLVGPVYRGAEVNLK